MIELYFDGCCEPINPGGNGGAGAIIKKDGQVVAQISKYCGSGEGMTNNVAEYQAFIVGLEYILVAGWENEEVKVFGDSQLVLKQMELKWKIKRGAYSEKALEAMAMRLKFKDISFEWIPREKNIECDCLSKIGASQKPR